MRFAVFLVQLILFVNLSLAADYSQVLAALGEETVLRTNINNQWTIRRVFHRVHSGCNLEAGRLKSYQHPNLVKVLDLKYHHGELIITEEDVDYHNNLYSLIFDNARKITFTVEQKIKILLQIAQVYSYLVEEDDVLFSPHIDLICINHQRVKVARYYRIYKMGHIEREGEHGVVNVPKDLCLRFLAPEHFHPDNEISSEHVIYYFGSIMLAVLAEELPYSQYDISNLFDARCLGLQPEIPQVISSEHAELIRRCLLIDPKERPKWKEIISLLQNYLTQNQRIIEITNTNIWSDISFIFFSAWQWAG